MPNILIANIGNRNILYQGESHFAMVKQKKLTFDFRTFTQQLLENFEEEKPHIQPNIINTLLDEKCEKLDRVILFSSSQPEEERQDQDTCFEGELLAKILPSQYPNLIVENRILKAPVTDNNLLMKAYRDELKAIDLQFPDATYMICDAGGTAQQKSALKIVFEYLFDREDFEVYHVAQGIDYKSEIKLSEPIEYRRILDAEQILSLIEQANYRGALEIFSRLNRRANESPVYQLLNFGRYRMERLWLEAQKFAKIENYPASLHPHLDDLINYKKLKPSGDYSGWITQLFSKKAYFELCESFAILQRYSDLDDYTAAVLNIFRFIENYLYHIMDEQLGYHFNQDFLSAQQMLAEDVRRRNKYRGINRRFPARRIRGGVPLFIMVSAYAPEPPHGHHKDFLKSFTVMNSLLNREFKGESDHLPLDTLRHQIAHKGLGVTKAEFKSIPGIDDLVEKWAQWLQVSSINPYLRLNQKIELLL